MKNMKAFLKKHLKKIIIIGVILLVSGIGVFRIKAQNDTEEKIKLNPKKEIIVKPERKDIEEEITLTGSIDASEKANLRFQASGQLAWVGVKIGDSVKKYQAIAGLNQSKLRKQLQYDFNTYRSALATFDDTQNTYKDEKDNLILTDDMKRILVRSQNTLDNSVIAYELQELTLRYSTLTTPISGIVTDIDQPSSGINVTPATATFYIINPESIYFKAQIDQEDVVKIKVGNKTTISLDSFPDQELESEIIHINFTPVSGQSSTVYEVHFKLPTEDNQDLKYRIGMDGDAVISLRKIENTLIIPIDSTHQEDDKDYVLVKESDEKNLVKRFVKLGIEIDDNIEVLEGLTENDQIVTSK
jgi:membrane fusion protein, macrolide-specific efflux system